MNPRGARAGNQRERDVDKLMRSLGYLAASRRHEGGGGDRVYLRAGLQPILCEIKATLDVPWRSTFGPLARAELVRDAALMGAEALLAWWPPHLRGGPIWLPASDWPNAVDPALSETNHTEEETDGTI